jgi:hypothetical protein
MIRTKDRFMVSVRGMAFLRIRVRLNGMFRIR